MPLVKFHEVVNIVGRVLCPVTERL